MSEIQINPPSSSLILAQGRVGRFSRGWLFLAIAVGILAALGALLMFALGPSFPIPEGTVAIFSVQPNIMNTVLADEEKKALPQPWQEAIKKNGRWPVLLGVVRRDGLWEAYALTPRWTSAGNLPTQTKWLVRWIGASPKTGSTLRYTDQWRWRNKIGKANLLAWINLHALFQDAVPSEELTPDGTFVLSWDGKTVKTTIPFSPGEKTLPLVQADISLNLPKDILGQNPAVRTFLERLPLGDQTLKELDPEPNQVNLWLKDGVTTGVSVKYAAPLGQKEASLVLGALGVANEQRFTLPDGTLALERVPLQEKEVSFGQDYTRYDGGTVHLETKEAFLNWPLTVKMDVTPPAAPCFSGEPWARFSQQTVASIGRSMELPPLPHIILQPMQLFSDRGRLVFCLEK